MTHAEHGSCPTCREAPTPSPPPPPAGQSSATPTPARDARLAAIRLTDGKDATPVTLSSAFRPTVTTYGAVVSAQTAVATLCLQVPSTCAWLRLPALDAVLVGSDIQPSAYVALMICVFALGRGTFGGNYAWSCTHD